MLNGMIPPLAELREQSPLRIHNWQSQWSAWLVVLVVEVWRCVD